MTRNPKSHGKESKTVIALGIIVLLLGAYLVYALVHPERF
ncbi:K(+)-transporting ATPase subunit F [Flintibacter sp. NSJ-23]|uniref:K(+)-transporting ATPase subunit F n=1 Tax=Flintibacter hominis TaxID=2763048 RepID=A0A8J6JAB7_9FIRM|nr:K(+)-transporting ATPase subunit F [Flintibacter hominis]MBS5589921.1 K(+)-transporting ATPase subunit F [Clostridiales bacterium]